MVERDSYEAPEWLELLVDRALPDGDGLLSWVPADGFEQSSLVRVPRFPTEVNGASPRELELDVLANGTRSAQLAVASREPITDLRAEVSDFVTDDGRRIPSTAVQCRFVGYVPVERSYSEFDEFAGLSEISGEGISGDGNPDVIADPLLETATIDVPAYRAQPIWISIAPDAETEPGRYEGDITLSTNETDQRTVSVTLNVPDVTLPDRSEYDFHLDVWLNPDAVAVEHGAERWSADHWSLLDRYFEDLAAAGQSAITVPIIHQPWEIDWIGGEWRPQTEVGYSSHVEWHYDGEWRFEYDIFDRYVETALEHGIGPEIYAYSMMVFRGPQRLSYHDHETDTFTVEQVTAGEDRWREAWTAFLTTFQNHLEQKGWLEKTYLAFDERPPEQMQVALDLVESVVPELSDQIHVAGSVDVESYADDFSVLHEHLPLDPDLVETRAEAGKRTTYYVCVTPAHPNTFTASPLRESRMLPWIAADNDLDGLLRWAYNSWPRNPEENPVFRCIQGDEYLVYPGREGPKSSIRWEQLREGIEDHQLVAALQRRTSDADALERALRLATRHEDAREKPVSDLVSARRLVIDELESLPAEH